jgi:small subunit ribosomal protein S20
MPHTRSARKNLRKNEKRRLNNRAIKREIRTFCKRVVTAAGEGNAEKLKQEFVLAVKKIDKAAAKRVIHPNMAARRKSQLARFVNAKAGANPPQQKPAS